MLKYLSHLPVDCSACNSSNKVTYWTLTANYCILQLLFTLNADDNAEDRTPRNPVDSKWSLPSNNPSADALFGEFKLLISRFSFINTSFRAVLSVKSI